MPTPIAPRALSPLDTLNAYELDDTNTGRKLEYSATWLTPNINKPFHGDWKPIWPNITTG